MEINQKYSLRQQPDKGTGMTSGYPMHLVCSGCEGMVIWHVLLVSRNV